MNLNTLTLLVKEAPQLVLHVRLLLLQPLLRRPGDKRALKRLESAFFPPQRHSLIYSQVTELGVSAHQHVSGVVQAEPLQQHPLLLLLWNDTRDGLRGVCNSSSDSTRRQFSRREEWGRPPSLQSLRFLSSSTPCRSISSRRWFRSLSSTRRLSVDTQGSVCTCKGEIKRQAVKISRKDTHSKACCAAEPAPASIRWEVATTNTLLVYLSRILRHLYFNEVFSFTTFY